MEHVADHMVRTPRVHGPHTTAAELRGLFANDHVHLALIVDSTGRLLTTVERRDLVDTVPDGAAARAFGRLRGRTISPTAPIAVARARLEHGQRRRLAVVDSHGRLRGLLCLKRDGTGFCSDTGVRRRAFARRLPLELTA